MIQYNDIQLAIVIGLTLIATVALSKALGCLLPMFAKKIKLDPAIMATPLITTLVDIFSILVYFQIATAIMHIWYKNIAKIVETWRFKKLDK